MLHYITSGDHSHIVAVWNVFLIQIERCEHTIQNDQGFVNSSFIYLFLFIY